ncbi:hypothetical protein [Flavobacterium sp.]|jgi:hypothetical protein|uniref:hypothetical protein n=1 Tax=Flavobacterium sp. TaxID=239 RepID=UPI0037C02576
MKNIIKLLFLFFTLSFYSQNDTITVLKPYSYVIESIDSTKLVYKGLDDKNSILRLIDTVSYISKSNISFVFANKLNVVYRGLENKISIVVPNSKSFTASGNYLYKNSNNEYVLLAGFGDEALILLNIEMNDGSIRKEKHEFRIKDIPNLYGKINKYFCNHSILLMSKEELLTSKLSVGFPSEFPIDINIELLQFTVEIDNKTYLVNGNKFNNEVTSLISQLPINSKFSIKSFKSNVNFNNCKPYPIQNIEIMIVEDNYFKNDEFDK